MARLYRVQKSPTIYEEEREGTLRPFLGEQPFLEKGYQFGQEQVISPEEFGQYQLGAPIGSEFIKTDLSPTVFRTSGGQATPIESEQAYRQLTGAKEGQETDWSKVATVSPETLSKYKLGGTITPEGAGFERIAKEVGLIPEREEERKGIFSRMAEAIRGAPEEARRVKAEAMEKFGLTEAQAKVSGILEKAEKINTQYEQASTELEGKPISANLIRGRKGLLRRQQMVEVKGLAALAEIAQGEVSNAITLVNDAVSEAIDIESANIEALKVEMSEMELSPMQEMKFKYLINERERNIAKEETLRSEKMGLYLTLIQSGVEVSPTETFDQLANKLREFAGDEKAKSEMGALGLSWNPMTMSYEKLPEKKSDGKTTTLTASQLTKLAVSGISREDALAINELSLYFGDKDKVVNYLVELGNDRAETEKLVESYANTMKPFTMEDYVKTLKEGEISE